MGIITATTKFSDCRKVTVSAFCRRRLPIIMCRLKMAETVKEAVTFVEQGHIRVGPQTVTDPAFLVNRTMEDYVTWVDTSKIKRKIMKYNDKVRLLLAVSQYLYNSNFCFSILVGRLRSFVNLFLIIPIIIFYT
jgi:ribosomal protein S4